jgi:chromosomal replication initiation ATPase DnaA
MVVSLRAKAEENVREYLRTRGLEEAAERIALAHNVTVLDLHAKAPKYPHLVRARLSWWEHLRELGWSYPAIGRFVGRDHTTICVGLNRKWGKEKGVQP